MREIVAPAGDFNALKAAVINGANAVYLGLKNFSARAKAGNFTGAELKAAVNYAHLFNVKVYVAINTIIKDREMEAALDSAKYAQDCGADALIIQDLGFLKLLKQNGLDIPVHASTQMGIHNLDGAIVAQKLGFKRVVLSRETLLEDIIKIKNGTGLELEYFVHGALCVSFSGNCYFSSIVSSYSANRGKCLQLCRKAYEFDGKKQYCLSAKDLCLLKYLDRLESAGITSFKIEGRMRSAQYVAESVRIYSNPNSADINESIANLKRVYNRGNYCSGYLKPDAQFNIIYNKLQGNMGALVGKIQSIKNKSAMIDNTSFDPNDGFKVLRGGYEVCGAQPDNKRAGAIKLFSDTAKTGDEVYKTFDGALKREIDARKRVIPLRARVSIYKEAKPFAKVIYKDNEYDFEYAVAAQNAQNKPLTKESIIAAFSKTGDTEFIFDRIDVDTDNFSFMPLSHLNEFRRQVLDGIKAKILSKYRPFRSILPQNTMTDIVREAFLGKGTMVLVGSVNQISSEILDKTDYIAIKPDDYNTDFKEFSKLSKPLLLFLPLVSRNGDTDIIRRAANNPIFSGIIANNLYALNLTKLPVLLGHGLNIINDHIDLPKIASIESDTMPSQSDWLYSYGHIPLMTFSHCPFNKCVSCNGAYKIKDEKDNTFICKRYRIKHCYWELFNSVPTNLLSYNKANRFIDALNLTSLQILQVLTNKISPTKFTRGNIDKELK